LADVQLLGKHGFLLAAQTVLLLTKGDPSWIMVGLKQDLGCIEINSCWQHDALTHYRGPGDERSISVIHQLGASYKVQHGDRVV
jgi:hypothetical protein